MSSLSLERRSLPRVSAFQAQHLRSSSSSLVDVVSTHLTATLAFGGSVRESFAPATGFVTVSPHRSAVGRTLKPVILRLGSGLVSRFVMSCVGDPPAMADPDVRLDESIESRLVMLVSRIGLDPSGCDNRFVEASVYALVWTGVVARGWKRRSRGRNHVRLAAVVAGEDAQPWKSWAEAKVFGPGPSFGFFVGWLTGPGAWADSDEPFAVGMEGEVYAPPE